MKLRQMLSKEHSILDYKLCDNDLSFHNPYLNNLAKIISENSSLSRQDLASLLLTYRNDFVTEYCFTIPYYDVLAKVASCSPIVEIGAGSGYWARCLSKMGADVVAYDSLPPGEQTPGEWDRCNPWFDDSWYNIIEGDESAAADHPDRALFMAWPVPMNPMAYNALSCYKKAGGKTIIYIGDPHPASSGDQDFYRMLYENREIENIDLYSWPGIREKLLIYLLV